MKTYFRIPMILFLLCGMLVNGQVPERNGWWQFDGTSSLQATLGQDLTGVGEIDVAAGPSADNKAVHVGTGSYLVMAHDIAAPVNEYTLQVDFSIPVQGVWNAIYQTNPDNLDDAELFVNTDNLIGAWRFAYSTNALEVDSWYRMVLTVKNGEFIKLYMNGELWVDGAGQEVDGRDALTDQVLFFADEDGEDTEIICSELAIWDLALTPEEVAELGDASPPIGTAPGKTDSLMPLGQNYPNPCRDMTRFAYHLENAGEVTFMLYNFAGSQIWEIHKGNMVAGDHVLDLDVQSLAPGIYVLRMEFEGQSFIRKMEVVH